MSKLSNGYGSQAFPCRRESFRVKYSPLSFEILITDNFAVN